MNYSGEEEVMKDERLNKDMTTPRDKYLFM
jgi:hypothetical protein